MPNPPKSGLSCVPLPWPGRAGGDSVGGVVGRRGDAEAQSGGLVAPRRAARRGRSDPHRRRGRVVGGGGERAGPTARVARVGPMKAWMAEKTAEGLIPDALR